MKKYVLPFFMLSLFYTCDVNAQAKVSYAEEVEALGLVAGQGLACGAERYDTFEMLARAILITKASSDSMQEQGMHIYNEKKASSYVSKQFGGFFDCKETNARFNRQDIFNTTLYADGTIKMSNGEIFTPRTPYDVTLIYEKNGNDRVKAQEIYDSVSGDGAKKSSLKVEGAPTTKAKAQASRATKGVSQPQDATVKRISRGKR